MTAHRQTFTHRTHSLQHTCRLHLLLPVTAILLAISATFSSCRGGESQEELDQRVGLTAIGYYRHLQHGRYTDFVAGLDGADSMPADYRQQLCDNAAMHLHRQHTRHKSIDTITLTSCHADTATRTAQALLSLHYADSTTETVSVPLVCRNGIWYMR